MKIIRILASLLTIGALALVLAACATDKERTAQLEAKAKITKADAEKIALAKVLGGTVTAGEIEKEGGKLIWSFDISTPGAADITEVQVDALTGEVVSVVKESAADQEKEKKEDAKKKGKKDKDDDEKDEKK